MMHAALPPDILLVLDGDESSGEPIYFADFVHDYPEVGGVGEYSARLFAVLRSRYGARLHSMRALEALLGPVPVHASYLDRERVALQRLALTEPGALVIVPNFQSPVSAKAPCRLRIINVVHDVPFANLPDEYVNTYHQRLDHLYRETCTNADHVAFVSEVTQRHFLARYGTPRHHSVIAPVMDMAPGKSASSRENFMLVVAHFAFHEHKNFDGVVQLFARLAERDPELRLVLTGRGRELFLPTLADVAPAVRARIDHRGFVSKDELQSLYARARAFLSLSRFEGFDMPSVEAAMHGTPLILSDIPVRHELFGDSACIVDALRPDVERILQFLAQPRVPQARIDHALPSAVAHAFGKAVARLQAPGNATRFADVRLPLRRRPLLKAAHALLATTVLAMGMSLGDFSIRPAGAAQGPVAVGGGGCPADGQGGGDGDRGASLSLFSSAFAQAPCPAYYNGAIPLPPLDVVSTVAATIRLANDRQGLMVTNGILGGMLLGRNEQINCTDCITGFGSVGSFSAGFHGRKQITPDLSIVGGIGFAEYRNGGVHVTSTPIIAGLFRYDWTELGTSRPFAELGGIVSPAQRTVSTRNYGFGGTLALGRGSSNVASGTIFGRLGWLTRFKPQDEAAVAVELARGWQRFGGYSEAGLPSNPYPLSTSGGTDEMNTVKFGGQWTHLWGARIETQFNIGVARSFGSRSGLNANFFAGSLGPIALGEYTWAEYGARIGYRVQQNFVIDLFADGTLGGRPIGNTIHGGIAGRYAF